MHLEVKLFQLLSSTVGRREEFIVETFRVTSVSAFYRRLLSYTDEFKKMWNRRGTVIITIQCLMYKQRYLPEETEQIRPGLNANEIKIPYDKHQKVF